MMKVIVTHNTNSISFEVEKNLPEHEAFEVIRAFTVSAFENLPDPLVYSLAGSEESFRLQGPKDWKEGLQNHFQRSVICLNVVAPLTESDGESDSYVFLTEDGSDKKTAEVVEKYAEPIVQEETVQIAEPVVQEETVQVEDQKAESPQPAEQEEPVIEDAEEDLEDKEIEQQPEEPQEQEGSAPSPESMKQRIMQFIVEIGSEAVQNIVAVAHSLVSEGADLGDALRTAVETSEKAANHPLTKDLLAIMDVYVQKFQNQCNWQPILAQFNIDHIVALIPNIVEALTRSMEGADHVELNMAPLMMQFCPLLAAMRSQIPQGEERVFQANPMNPFAVFEEARQGLAAEFQPEQPVHRGIVCDGCNADPIVGVRYKSVLRANFDLCEECEKNHDPSDPLIKIKTPLDQMDTLPGLREFRRQVGGGRGRPCHFRGGRGRGRCGRGRGRGRCKMVKKMMEHMKKQCEGSDQKNCDWKKGCEWWKNKCREWKSCAPRCDQDRRDPAREVVVQKKEEMKCKKQEIKAQKKEMKQKKKEMKQLKKEMKHLKKQAKKDVKEKKEKYAATVVAHLDSDETSVQKPGTCCLHQWKVKNTGTATWNGDVIAMFAKGNKSIVADGFEVLDVGEVQPGHVTYIPCMLNVPTLPGSYTAMFRLTTPDGLKFGEKLRCVIEVADDEPPAYEEVEQEVSSPKAAPSFSSIPGSNIPQTIEDVPSSASAPEKEEVEEIPEVSAPEKEEVEEIPEVPEQSWEFAEQLQQLKDMGFEMDDDSMHSILVVVKGDLGQALALLMQ